MHICIVGIIFHFRYILLLCRFLANILVLMLLALSTYIIQLCVERSRQTEIKKRKGDIEIGFWEEQEVILLTFLILLQTYSVKFHF